MRSFTLSLLTAVLLVGCTAESDDQSRSDDLRGPTKPRVVVSQPVAVESSEFLFEGQPMVPGKWYRVPVGPWYRVPVEKRIESDYEVTQLSLEQPEKILLSEIKAAREEVSQQQKELSSLVAKSNLLATELNHKIDQLQQTVDALEQRLSEQGVEVPAESE